VDSIAKIEIGLYIYLNALWTFLLTTPLSLIKVLVEAYPGGVKQKNKYGFLPIHRACEYGQKEEVIQYLDEVYPMGVETKDKQGHLPIHIACCKNASLDVIDYLIHSYPGSMKIKNNFGYHPFQCLKLSSENRTSTTTLFQNPKPNTFSALSA